MSKRNKLIILIVSILVIAIGVILFLFVFNKKEAKKEKKEVEEEQLIEDSSYQKLENDLNNGTLSKDQYVLRLAYTIFEPTKLEEKYKSSNNLFRDDFVETEIEKYIDDISSSTAKYILDKIFLSDVTFNIDNQSKTSNIDNIIPSYMENDGKTYNSQYQTNLNNVLVSDSQNFIVWYTTEGDSKVTYEQAKSIADDLDSTIEKYDELFETEYKFQSELDFDDSDKFISQQKILESKGYDKKILKTKMSVYLIKKPDGLDDGASAAYLFQPIGVNKIINELNKIINESDYDSDYDISYVTVPYIVFYTENFENKNSSLAMINHELFHHYQRHVISFANSSKIKEAFSTDYSKIILDATANWASAKVSPNNGEEDIKNNMLNDWAANNKTFHRNTFSDENFGVNGGYPYFMFLNAYEKYVQNGTNLILKSMYENKPFDYLEENAARNQMKVSFQYLALRTLDQDYANNNYLANTSHSKYSFTVEEIKLGNSKNNEIFYKGGFEYYKFNKVDSTAYFNIKVNEDYDAVSLMLIAYKDGKYSVLNDYELDTTYTTVDLSKYKNFYDTMYFTIVNSSFKKDVKVDFSIDSVAKQQGDKKTKEEPKQEEKEEEKKEEYVPNSETFQTGIKNYNIKITSYMSMSGIESKTISEGVTDELHQKQYLKSNSTVMGFSVTSEIYSDYKNNISYTLEPFSSEWYKDTGVSNYMSMSLIVDKLNKDKNVTKLGDNKYKVKFTKDDLKTIVNKDTDASAIKGDVYGIVYTSGKYITKMEYDFSNIIDLIDKYTMVIEFSNYDKAGDVNIPVSATK